MSKTQLFEKWTFAMDFDPADPEQKEFAEYVDNNRSKHVTSPESCSKYNEQTMGKRSTIHVLTVRAAIEVAKAVTTMPGNLALGCQSNNAGTSLYVCCEYEDNGKCYVGAYNTVNGSFRVSIMNADGSIGRFPAVQEGNSEMLVLYILLVYASLQNNDEFKSKFDRYFNDPDPLQRGDIEDMYCLCDNLYRRVETLSTTDRMPVSIPTSNNIPTITKLKFDSGEYAPTAEIFGNFQYLTQKAGSRRTVASITELKKMYGKQIELTENEKAKVPDIAKCTDYQISESLELMVKMASVAQMSKFMLRGPAGVGKTTDAKLLAAVLGLPYRVFTCSENTDEMDLLANMLPNTGVPAINNSIPEPSFQDMMMDPATALSKYTGVYEEGIDAEQAYKQILANIVERMSAKQESEKNFVMVESEIIKACRRPAVIEIQEPACIAKPATLVRLNGLLDDGASITLLNGETISVHPDTIFVFTTNSVYRGCRDFNESVLSRMDLIVDYEFPSVDELTERAIAKTGIDRAEHDNVKQMAEVMVKIQDYLEENYGTGGICGPRELTNWVKAYMVVKDIREAATSTIVSHASKDKEAREDILLNIINAAF